MRVKQTAGVFVVATACAASASKAGGGSTVVAVGKCEFHKVFLALPPLAQFAAVKALWLLTLANPARIGHPRRFRPLL